MRPAETRQEVIEQEVAEQAAQSQEVKSQILVIGYGNPLRRDDGAGRVVAEMLAQCWSDQGIAATVVTEFQLTPEMAEEFAGDVVGAVVFVDSRVNPSSFGFQISPLEIDMVSPTLGHHMDPATLLVYAALLYGRTPRAWLVTVPGKDFAHGSGFSAEVEELLDGVTALAGQLLSAMKESVPCMNSQLPNA